ncbi:SOS response-associated peptidase family protein [Sphingobium sp. B2D3C]|uniref:SOS response-associated peptidase family protein n=1 Tax=Sphingobium sp. B2D3C TaxID=2940581 RepID=UPI002225230A|nr:SOS response-associated peptidase [Sphingobium sp. B2D3C]MCW2397950.1 putative SOS response-associated peptidase YedK [Sphingobium sp. B2D3C]
MCNDYRLEVEIASIMEDFDDLEINIETPEGVPEDNPRADIRMTDVAPIVRAVERPPGNYRAVGELINRRWSWPGKSGPVYNFRSEGFGGKAPDLSINRCLILCDGFYEFTNPVVPRPKDKRLDKWLFTMKGHRWFCMAGIWQADPKVGEAFTLLTMDAGDDIKPYHHRQIIPLARDRWADWLNPKVPAEDVLEYLPTGMLTVTQIYPLPPGEAEQPKLAL